ALEPLFWAAVVSAIESLFPAASTLHKQGSAEERWPSALVKCKDRRNTTNEYYSEWYCYTAFCPSDNTISQLQSYYTTYCKMVPDFNPTNQFSPLGTVIGVVKASASAAPGATAANGQPVLAVPSAVGGASGAGVGGAASPSAAPLTALPQPPSQQSVKSKLCQESGVKTSMPDIPN
ncbi:hypothetical protein BC830DRAFT_1086974, partial [Chytriomyces sp. MP71]